MIKTLTPHGVAKLHHSAGRHPSSRHVYGEYSRDGDRCQVPEGSLIKIYPSPAPRG